MMDTTLVEHACTKHITSSLAIAPFSSNWGALELAVFLDFLAGRVFSSLSTLKATELLRLNESMMLTFPKFLQA